MGWYPAIYYSLDSKSDKRAETPWKGVRSYHLGLWGSTTAILHFMSRRHYRAWEEGFLLAGEDS
jgi:hypothetical protein